jgi:hypothetical protein
MKSNRLGLSGSSHGLGGSNWLISNHLWLSGDIIESRQIDLFDNFNAGRGASHEA